MVNTNGNILGPWDLWLPRCMNALYSVADGDPIGALETMQVAMSEVIR